MLLRYWHRSRAEKRRMRAMTEAIMRLFNSRICIAVMALAIMVIYMRSIPMRTLLFHTAKEESVSAIKYYDIARHQRWRAAVLRRAKYLCQECARYGRCTPQGLPVPATIAHHIQPVEEHPELRLVVNNGEVLCAACHNARNPEKGGIKGDPPLMA